MGRGLRWQKEHLVNYSITTTALFVQMMLSRCQGQLGLFFVCHTPDYIYLGQIAVAKFLKNMPEELVEQSLQLRMSSRLKEQLAILLAMEYLGMLIKGYQHTSGI